MFSSPYQASAGSGSNPDQSKRDVSCQSARVLTFPLSVSFPQCRKLIRSLPKLYRVYSSMSLSNRPTKGGQLQLASIPVLRFMDREKGQVYFCLTSVCNCGIVYSFVLKMKQNKNLTLSLLDRASS